MSRRMAKSLALVRTLFRAAAFPLVRAIVLLPFFSATFPEAAGDPDSARAACTGRRVGECQSDGSRRTTMRRISRLIQDPLPMAKLKTNAPAVSSPSSSPPVWPRHDHVRPPECGAPFRRKLRSLANPQAPAEWPRQNSSSRPSSSIEPFAEPRSCPEQQRSNSRLTSSHNFRHLCGAQLLECGKQQNVALSLRQSLHFAENSLHPSRFVQGFVSRHTPRDQTLREALIHLLWSYPPPPINREIPCNPNEPDAHVPHRRQRERVLHHANKDVLNNIFSFSSTSQDGMGHAKEKSRIGLHQSHKVYSQSGALHRRQSQAASLCRNHGPEIMVPFYSDRRATATLARSFSAATSIATH